MTFHEIFCRLSKKKKWEKVSEGFGRRYSVALTEAELAVKKAFLLTEAERDAECEPAMPPSEQSACADSASTDRKETWHSPTELHPRAGYALVC